MNKRLPANVNMFKVSNIDTRNRWFTYSTPFSSSFIVDFEQVNNSYIINN